MSVSDIDRTVTDLDRTVTGSAAGQTLTEAETLVGPPRTASGTGKHPVRLGPYDVIGLLGEGAMGRVYRALDARSGRLVAVKRIKTRFSRNRAMIRRFVREAEAVSQLSHPGLVTVLDASDDWIAMELVEGESLEGRLARAGTLPPAQAVAVLAEVAAALDYIHARGVVHRDIKPSNLLLLPEGGVKISDFGIARLSWAPMTRSGEVLGTPAYMAPEQILLGDAEPATDIYALGLVAFELLTGQRAFSGRSYAQLLLKVMDGPPPSAHFLDSSLPPAVDEVIARVLAKDPDDRYESAVAFVTALRAAVLPAESPLVRIARRLVHGFRSLIEG